MKFIRLLITSVLFVLAVVVAPVSAEPIVKVYGGANLIGYDGAIPSDFEAGVTARASLQPHVSLVGASFYGFERDDIRTTAGFRLTASDVDNPNFSVGVGMQYQIGDGSEWQGETSIGWKPGIGEFVLGAQGFYGLKSNAAGALIAVRHPLLKF